MIYFILLFLFVGGAFLFDSNQKNESRGKYFYWFCYLLLTLTFGLRYRVGGDTINYLIKYSMTPPISELSIGKLFLMNVEPGFALLMSFFKQFSDAFYGVQLVESAFVNFVWFRLIQKRVSRKFLGIIFFYIMYSFYFNTEIMREAMAVAFFVLAYSKLEKQKLLQYYVILTIGVLFHYSCIFMYIVPILKRYAVSMKKTFFIALSVLLFLSFSSVIFSYFGGYLAYKISANEAYNFTIWGKLAAFIKYILFPYVVLRLATKYYRPECIRNEVNFLYIQMVIGAMSLSSYSILMRLSNYMQPFFLVVMVNVLGIVLLSKYKNAIYAFMLLFFVWFSYVGPYLSDVSDVKKGARFYCRWYPYYSIFNEQEDPVREEFLQAHFNR